MLESANGRNTGCLAGQARGWFLVACPGSGAGGYGRLRGHAGRWQAQDTPKQPPVWPYPGPRGRQKPPERRSYPILKAGAAHLQTVLARRIKETPVYGTGASWSLSGAVSDNSGRVDYNTTLLFVKRPIDWPARRPLVAHAPESWPVRKALGMSLLRSRTARLNSRPLPTPEDLVPYAEKTPTSIPTGREKVGFLLS